MSERKRLHGIEAEEDAFQQLIRLSGGRPAIEQAVAHRVHQQLHSQWQGMVRARRLKRWRSLLGAAAVLVIAFFAISRYLGRPGEDVASFGVVENIRDHVTVTRGVSNTSSVVTRGDVLASGSTIETGDYARMLVRLPGGASLRLDRGTRIHIESAGRISLEQGAVYFDSRKRNRGSTAFVMSTGLGTIRNVGTQFEVRMNEQGMQIRVREGMITLQQGDSLQHASAGAQLSVHADGKVRSEPVPVYGPDWAWISHISPSFAMEGRNLRQFLDWVSHENGWIVEFEDESMKQDAVKTLLHGPELRIPSERMPAIVLPVCGLKFTLENGVLLIKDRTRS